LLNDAPIKKDTVYIAKHTCRRLGELLDISEIRDLGQLISLAITMISIEAFYGSR
jgi:hypothetical protein